MPPGIPVGGGACYINFKANPSEDNSGKLTKLAAPPARPAGRPHVGIKKPPRRSGRSGLAEKYNPHKARGQGRRCQSGLFNTSRVVGSATTQLSGLGSFWFLRDF